jgi:hypothetical protein
MNARLPSRSLALLACAASLAWLWAMPAHGQAPGRSRAGENAPLTGGLARAHAPAKTRPHAHATPAHPRRRRTPTVIHTGGSSKHTTPHRPAAPKAHGHKQRSSGGHAQGGGSHSSPSAPSKSAPTSPSAPRSQPAQPITPSTGTPVPKASSPTTSSHGVPARNAPPSSSARDTKAVGHAAGDEARRGGLQKSQAKQAGGGAGGKRASAHSQAPSAVLPQLLAASLDSFRRARSPTEANRGHAGSAPLGVKLPPLAHSSLPLVIAVAGAAVLIALLFFDGLGYGPRHRGWKVRSQRRRAP